MVSPKTDETLDTLIDEELIPQVHAGDAAATQYILNKYEQIVHKKANGYFLMGSDRDDVVQEGRIGLFKAIADFDKSKNASFRSFAELCITRQIITSIKSATRLKHLPLNSYVSIYKPVHEDEETRTLLEMIDDEATKDPLEQIVHKENSLAIKNEMMKALTQLEWNVLAYYLHGYSYEEIADKLNRHEKSIDNALQRVRRKVGELLKNNLLYD